MPPFNLYHFLQKDNYISKFGYHVSCNGKSNVDFGKFSSFFISFEILYLCKFLCGSNYFSRLGFEEKKLEISLRFCGLL